MLNIEYTFGSWACSFKNGKIVTYMDHIHPCKTWCRCFRTLESDGLVLASPLKNEQTAKRVFIMATHGKSIEFN